MSSEGRGLGNKLWGAVVDAGNEGERTGWLAGVLKVWEKVVSWVWGS